MNIHEFQGKSLLSQFDIPVQPGIVLDLQSNLTSLKTLAERGIVTFEKVGREKTYRLNREEVATQLRELANIIENCDCKRGSHDD